MSYQNIYKSMTKRASAEQVKQLAGLIKRAWIPDMAPTYDAWRPEKIQDWHSMPQAQRLNALNQLFANKQRGLKISDTTKNMANDIASRAKYGIHRKAVPDLSQMSVREFQKKYNMSPKDYFRGSSTGSSFSFSGKDPSANTSSFTIPGFGQGGSSKSQFTIPGQKGPGKVQFSSPGAQLNVGDIINPGNGKPAYSFVNPPTDKLPGRGARFFNAMKRHPVASTAGVLLLLATLAGGSYAMGSVGRSDVERALNTSNNQLQKTTNELKKAKQGTGSFWGDIGNTFKWFIERLIKFFSESSNNANKSQTVQ